MQIDVDALLDIDVQWTPKTVILRKYRITEMLKDKVVDKVVQVVHDKSLEGKALAFQKALNQLDE